MIPLKLDDWSVDAVTDLVTQGYQETDRFDFKSRLGSKDPKEKSRLPKTCAAFANSMGGFLVFGVEDGGSGFTDRLVGLNRNYDFGRDFGNHPQLCSPSVVWEPVSPPLELPSGNRIHVVHVPKSWAGPHAVKDGAGGWIFPKRTNRGNEDMDYSEIRSAFIRMEEKQARLRLMEAEFRRLEMDTSARLFPEDRNGMVIHGPLLSISLIETLIADVYPLFSSNRDIVSALEDIRWKAHSINRQAAIVAGRRPDPQGVVEQIRPQLHQKCGEALRLLAPFITTS